MKNCNPILLLICLISLSPAYGNSDTLEGKRQSLFDTWQEEQLSEVQMTIDLEELMAEKRTNNFIPATFSYQRADGTVETWDIKVRNRGRFRRMKCDFPPLKLRFPKNKLKEKGYKKHNDFKLVTRCLDDAEGRENLLREYLIYKMYAKLSHFSYRVQLVKIRYTCSETGKKDNQYGILLEDVKELASRFESKECVECYGLGFEEFNQFNLQTHALFQYMIGNTDWSITMSRNLKIFTPKAENELKFVIPYDFDFSGVVNAGYAVPQNSHGQTSVRQRVYLGDKWTAEEWAPAIGLFRSKKPELIALIDEFDLLNKKARKDIRKYLDEFYTALEEGYVPVQP